MTADSTASLRTSVTVSNWVQLSCSAVRLAKAVSPSRTTSTTMLPRPRCSRVSIFIRFNITTPGRCRDRRRTIVGYKSPQILTKTIRDEDEPEGSDSSQEKSSRRRGDATWTHPQDGQNNTASL